MSHCTPALPYAITGATPSTAKRPRPLAPEAAVKREEHASVAELVGSSEYRALSDDALKDEDNAAWVLGLDAGARAEWVRRIHWIRLVDRLAENERFEPEVHRFGDFIAAFRRLLADGAVAADDPHADVLVGIRDEWLADPEDPMAGLALEAWSGYLDALAEYHRPAICVADLEEHDTMLFRLSGHIFQLVPFLGVEHWMAAGEFGRLDQFFNNLRDLREDAANGICYLPAELLARFDLDQADVISGACLGGEAWQAMMQYWLDEHLPALRRRAESFFAAEGLHASLEIMRGWTRRRHARIERVFREVGFDYRRFGERYWSEVQRDLGKG